MRPYQIDAPYGPWVDLDHVQVIYPLGGSGESAYLLFRLMYQDQTASHTFEFWRHRHPVTPPTVNAHYGEMLRAAQSEEDDAVVSRKIAQMEWQAFFNAWTKQGEVKS